jgi:hypothetical protein
MRFESRQNSPDKIWRGFDEISTFRSCDQYVTILIRRWALRGILKFSTTNRSAHANRNLLTLSLQNKNEKRTPGSARKAHKPSSQRAMGK